jgi:peptide/nickel transport system permease protein
MSSLFTKERRIIYARRIKGFWEEFSRKKIGMLGLGMLFVFVAIAIFAPWLTPYDPIAQERIAQDFAMPQWVTIFPGNENLPTTVPNELYWTPIKGDTLVQGYGDLVTVDYSAKTLETVDVELASTFSHLNIPPNTFYAKLTWRSTDVQEVYYSLTLNVFTPNGTRYTIWKQDLLTITRGEVVAIESVDPFFRTRLGFEIHENPAPVILAENGEYTLVLRVRFKPDSMDAKAKVTIQDSEFVVLGHVHGILGCDNVGADVFSQVIYGARISLVIGLLAAGVGASIGIIVGVLSGYLGGLVDEVTMRVVDILLCLPLLPLLLTLVFLFGKNVFYIVLFIAIFGWQGLARIIRSQVLSLRETAFIECAKAAGASKFYIMIKHLIPNVLPIAFASLVLRVPAAILFEASLSFLGFGDPRVPTWGKMLHHAFGFGAFTHLAWWWLIPPGLAITLLCISFVFMGHALDEVVNPRLRRRR